jgi:hypothetical protein
LYNGYAVDFELWEGSDMASEHTSEAAPKKVEGAGVPGWLQVLGALVTIAATAYGTFVLSREKGRAEGVAQQIAVEKETPRIDQGRFVFAGDALKSVLSGKKDIAIEGLPNPEFVANDLGRRIDVALKSASALKQLQSISVEFVSFTNKGSRVAEALTLIFPGQPLVPLGSVAVNTTKLLPVFYERKQPYDHGEALQPTSYSFSYTLAGERHETTGKIAPRATVSWISVIGNTQGAGRALSDDDMEHHLELRPEQ